MEGLVRSGLPLAAVAALAAPLAAQEPAAPLVMAPSSQWVADYSEDNCALRRTFAAGTDSVVLQLRQYVPGDDFEVSIVSETLSPARGDPEIRFEPDDHWYVVRGARPFAGAGMRGIQYSDSLKPNAAKGQPGWTETDREARERAITGLTAAKTFDRDILLQTGSMHRAMDALRTCTDAMLGRWGLDPAAQKALSRKVVPVEMASWVRKVQAYYPATMAGTGRSGRVHVRMSVGVDGAPLACAVRAGEADPAFERAACATMMDYARFQPALGADGAPVASYYIATIVYAASG